MKKAKANNGFTMVELIVIIVIILVLSAVLVPSLLKYIDKAQRAKAKDDCRTCVVVAQGLLVEMYVSDGPGLTLDPGLVRKEAGASGVVSDIEISTDSELAHLAYTIGKYKVTYCAWPTLCAVHDEYFNFEDADGSGGSGGSGDAGESEGGGGGGETDAGGTVAGSVTWTDSDGNKHELKVTDDWETYKDTMSSSYDITVPPGTILSDETGIYLIYGWNGTFNKDNYRDNLSNLADANPNNVMKLSNDGKVLTQNDIKNEGNGNQWKESPKTGDICFYDGKYYVSPTGCNVNTFPPDGWIKVEQ